MGYSNSVELGAASHAQATCANRSHPSSAEITITIMNLNISNKTSVGIIITQCFRNYVDYNYTSCRCNLILFYGYMECSKITECFLFTGDSLINLISSNTCFLYFDIFAKNRSLIKETLVCTKSTNISY